MSRSSREIISLVAMAIYYTVFGVGGAIWGTWGGRAFLVNGPFSSAVIFIAITAAYLAGGGFLGNWCRDRLRDWSKRGA